MTDIDKPSACQFEVIEDSDGKLLVKFSGILDAYAYSETYSSILNSIQPRSAQPVWVDLSQVTRLDDFGAFLLSNFRQWVIEKGATFHLQKANPQIDEFLRFLRFESHEHCPAPKTKRSVNLLVTLGDSTINEAHNLVYMLSFLGSVVLSFMRVITRPKMLRVNDTITFMEKTGVTALPIVALISFLLGLIMAFMSSLQLKQFGANIYVASLVALAMVSELGPIITAIIVAGRSGSAFAAEIGTMKISEEIDALFTMGFEPTVFLVVPRIIAALIVVPVLTFFSDLFAIAGGLVVGVFILNLTANAYISQTLEALRLTDVFWGISKSAVFAALISLIGCLRGFQARGGASAVGNAATSAVVSSIFMIILFDSVFAIIRSYW